MPSRVAFDPTSACDACRGRHVRHTCSRVRNRRRRGYAPVRGCAGCARRGRHTCTAEERDAADAAQAAAVQAAEDAAAEREAAAVQAAAAAREEFNAERARECLFCMDEILPGQFTVRHIADCRMEMHLACGLTYVNSSAAPRCPVCSQLMHG